MFYNYIYSLKPLLLLPMPLALLESEKNAILCPYTHGQVVYIARALLSTVDPQNFFINECETDPSFVPRAKVVHVAAPQMLMYPNPAGDIVYFEIRNAEPDEKLKIWITDVGGKILIMKTMNMNQLNVLDVSNLANGCYSLHIILNQGQTFSEKICLIR